MEKNPKTIAINSNTEEKLILFIDKSFRHIPNNKNSRKKIQLQSILTTEKPKLRSLSENSSLRIRQKMFKPRKNHIVK